MKKLLATVMAAAFALSTLNVQALANDTTPVNLGVEGITIPNAVVTIPHVQRAEEVQALFEPGELPTVFIIVPNEGEGSFSPEVNLAKGLSLVMGVRGRVAIVDQSTHPEMVYALLHNSDLHQDTVTQPVWLFYRPESAPNAPDRAFNIWSDAKQQAPMTLSYAEKWLAQHTVVNPIVGAEATAADWPDLFNNSTPDGPGNAPVVSIWYREPMLLSAADQQSSWKPRLLFGVERWKYHKRVDEGDKIRFVAVVRVIEVDIDKYPDLFRKVFGTTTLPDLPQIAVFKDANSAPIIYKQGDSYSPVPAWDLTEDQFQTWLTSLNLPHPDNRNSNTSVLELSRKEKQAAVLVPHEGSQVAADGRP
jgi:hypothetical protein